MSGGGPAAGPEPDTRRGGGSPRRFSAAERARLLAAYGRWASDQASFCEAHGLSVASLNKWRAAARARGEAVAPRVGAGGGRAQGGGAVAWRRSSAEEKRAAVEAYARGSVSQGVLARLWGISRRSLSSWLSRYRSEGPRGLEPRRCGRPRGSRGSMPGAAVQEAIVEVARAQPEYGVRRIRSHLRRFVGLDASPTAVVRVLEARGVARATVSRARARWRCRRCSPTRSCRASASTCRAASATASR